MKVGGRRLIQVESAGAVNGRMLSSNEMSAQRTMMAAERTLLAWVRTAMSFISFGFTMYKILESAAVTLASKVEILQPEHLGLFLMAVGTVPLMVGMFQYYKTARQFGRTIQAAVFNASFLLAFVIVMLGVLLFLNVIFQWHLL